MTAGTLENLGVISDADLVIASRRGDRQAFGQIVRRYQGMITGLLYAECGDIHRSEDVAQETFVSAWKSLSGLKEPGKLTSWLCQIARHRLTDIARSAARETIRIQNSARARPAAQSSPAADQRIISEEEREMLWRNLAEVPQPYRETIVLYYRQGQSTTVVAAAMETSETTVRQRLARGRQMLREQIAEMIERDLVRTAPNQAFTLAVVASLPGLTIQSATASTVGGTVVKGAGIAKSAGLGGLFNAIFTPVLALSSIFFDYRLNMESARSPRRREFIRSYYRLLIALMLFFGIAGIALMLVAHPLSMAHPKLFAGLFIGLCAASVIIVVAMIVWMQISRRAMGQSELAEGRPLPAPVPLFEFRSKYGLFGLPLIHIRLRGGLERGPVKAWIAVGDAAIGVLFAAGAVAIAPISFGGIAAGLLCFGGCAFGLCTFGGFIAGLWAVGGMAIGLQAFGGCAIAWIGANGGVALAHDFATGAIAMAQHANDAAADAFFAESSFFRIVQSATRYADWLNLMCVVPFVFWYWNRRRLAASNSRPPS